MAGTDRMQEEVGRGARVNALSLTKSELQLPPKSSSFHASILHQIAQASGLW